MKRALCDSDFACGRCRVIVRSGSRASVSSLLPLVRRRPVHWGMFGEIPDQKVDVICSPSQTIRPPAGGQPRWRRLVHWGSRPHRYDREGTRRARVCPQQAGNTVVRASEGDRQHEPKRACHGNTFHALTCVIFVPSARFYMRSEATIRAVMVPVSRPKWASQGAKGPDI